MTRAPWDAGKVCMAQADRTGNPRITPAMTSVRPLTCFQVGHFSRRHSNSKAAGIAANSARPRPLSSGCISCTTMRVKGRVRLKITTPSRPRAMPVFSREDMMATRTWRVRDAFI
ncbi:hypothetical protein D3C84_977750 [compost metagenome]